MKKSTNILVGAAIAGILSASGAGMLDAKPAKEAKGECHGINSCKGQGECGGKEHACAGMNSCKGKGWISMSEKDCRDKSGQFKPAGMKM